MVDALVGTGAATERLGGADLVAPHLLDAEVGSVLRRLTLAGRLADEAAEAALFALVELEVLRWAHPPLLARAWAMRGNVTVYDGLYVALAEALDAPLLTLDSRLAGAPGVAATIEVLGTG
jgi:predicted nucleic acid-binding protein